MARNIHIEKFKREPQQSRKIEVVERKGIGHPDTICDAIMEKVSVNLSKEYREKFGKILHHNIDKGLLAAGNTKPEFKGGEITDKPKLIFSDRATFQHKEEEIPVNQIAMQTAKEWIKKHIRNLDPGNITYSSELKPAAGNLADIFEREGEVMEANDTSAAVGYAPLTDLEQQVHDLERYLNSEDYKDKHPYSGEDIKVMGTRIGNKKKITIAMAFVDRYIESEEDYFRKKQEAEQTIKEKLDEEVDIALNTLDERGRGKDGIYLTVTGTSAESGDSGQVGRGNGVNGIIPLNRPKGSEAAAGKNPVSHVGKIYNALTHKISREIYENVNGVEESYVWLLSQIGRKIDDPLIASVQVKTNNSTSLSEVRSLIKEEVNRELEDINAFCDDLSRGNIKVY